MMKILLISNTLPPEGSAVAGIVDRLAPQWIKSGCEVDGITLKKKLRAKTKFFYDGITVYRAERFLFFKKLSNLVKRVYRKLFKKTEKRVLYVEYEVKAYLRQLKKMDLRQYDAMIPICAYYETVEAVRRYKNKYGLTTPVFLYQVDPLAYNKTFDALDFDARLAYEKEIYSLCAGVFTTSIILREKQSLGWDMEKIHVLEFPLSKALLETSEQNDGSIQCVFCGSLYGTVRDAKYTLELFAKFKNPNIHLYVLGTGQERLLKEYAEGVLKGRLFCFGERSEKECNEMLARADVLVNVGNQVKNQIPSKIFHYISTGKPIVNVACFDDCPTAEYLNKYPLCYTIVEKAEARESDVSALEEWIVIHQGKKVSVETLQKHFQEHDPAFIVEKMLAIIKRS